MRGRLTVFVCALVTTLVIGIGTPGSANVITRSDGNDTKGPLDLSGAKVSHVSGGSVFQINTLAPFTNGQANGDNGLFEVGIDTNADRNPNYFIDAFFAAGRFRGVLFKPNGSVITYNLKAARVSPKAVKVTLPHSQIIQKGSYDFLIFSAYFAAPCTNKNPCVDAIPNRYPLIRHDYTAPTVIPGHIPVYSSEVSATLTFPIPFRVKDDVYGSGVKSWKFQRRAVGTSTWVTVVSGTPLVSTVDVTGVEGASYELRVIAIDRQRNKRTSFFNGPAIPWDDRNAVFTYSSSIPHDAVAGAFLGTTTGLALDQTITFTMPFSAQHVCLLGGPTTGALSQVDVSVDNSFVHSYTEDATTTPRASFCLDGEASGAVIEIKGRLAEPFIFDGLVAQR
jgi:hypothetical protein